MKKAVELAHSRQFVRSAVLPPPPPVKRGVGEADTAEVALEAGKAQAAVVGSDLVSFATNVAPQWRQDLINCSLFAQLWAKAEVADPRRIFDWYDAYFGALQQLPRWTRAVPSSRCSAERASRLRRRAFRSAWPNSRPTAA
jgi:hypothetical protein